MNAFHIQYRNTQGTLMRILTAVSRRGIDIPYLHAAAVDGAFRADLLLEVNAKQIGQLRRDWHAIVDVIDVRVAAPTPQMIENLASSFAAPHPPASTSASGRSVNAAMA